MMRLFKVIALFVTIGAATGVVLSRTSPPPVAQVAEEREVGGDVTEKELELYIAVYKDMQSDHRLTINEALRPHDTSLEQFRSIERRVQRQQRLVDRVRRELLEFSRARSVAPAPAAAAPDRASGRREQP